MADALAETGKLEKQALTCATPIMAKPMGFYAKQGLDVGVVRTAGWAVVRDKTLNHEYDAAHMLAPMPIALSMGLGSNATPFTVPLIENMNGQGICLAVEHKDERDPAKWQGFKFGIPFEYSNHHASTTRVPAEHILRATSDIARSRLALQLRILFGSESMGLHDSGDRGWRAHRSRQRSSCGRRRCGR